MTDELVLYTNPMSRGRTARWMLEEVGQPYRTVVLDYATTMKEPAYAAINPMRKVPAITHGDVVVTETAAICAYLADAFPAAGLAPPLGERADYYRWLFFAAGCVEPAVVNQALGVVPSAERQGMVGYGTLDLTLDALETAVADREFVAGDRFSAADVVVAAQIGFGLMFGTIAPRPAFTAYMARHGTRPALVRARAIDEELTPPEMRGKM